jgi:hypothetical protein
MAQYKASAVAVRENMARLQALRLANQDTTEEALQIESLPGDVRKTPSDRDVRSSTRRTGTQTQARARDGKVYSLVTAGTRQFGGDHLVPPTPQHTWTDALAEVAEIVPAAQLPR